LKKAYALLLLVSIIVVAGIQPINSVSIPQQKADLSMLAEAYGTQTENPRWNPNTDLNKDGIVNLADLVLLATWYGNNTDFKIHPQISMYYWAFVDFTPFFQPEVYFQPNNTQITSDMQTIKSLNCTSVMVADQELDTGRHNNNPSLYRSSIVLQECQKLGLDVIINFDAWDNTSSSGGYTSDLFPQTLKALQNYYRSCPNFIGFIFDDPFIPENQTAFNISTLENTVRTNFNVGRPYFLYFASSLTRLSTSIVGQPLDSVACDYYWEATINPTQPPNATPPGGTPLSEMLDINTTLSPSSTEWIEAVNRKYSENSTKYTVTLVFDASEWQVTPEMWKPQVNTAEQDGMRGLIWYAWNMTRSGNCIAANPTWWPTICQINQQFLEWNEVS
jgi:hypothetical protein